MLLLALHETTCDHSLLKLHVNFYCKALLCLTPAAELIESSTALFRRLILLVGIRPLHFPKFYLLFLFDLRKGITFLYIQTLPTHICASKENITSFLWFENASFFLLFFLLLFLRGRRFYFLVLLWGYKSMNT